MEHIAVKEERDELQETMDFILAEAQSEIDALNTKQADLETKRAEMLVRFEDLQCKRAAMDARINDLELKRSKLASDLERVQATPPPGDREAQISPKPRESVFDAYRTEYKAGVVSDKTHRSALHLMNSTFPGVLDFTHRGPPDIKPHEFPDEPEAMWETLKTSLPRPKQVQQVVKMLFPQAARFTVVCS